MQFFDTHSHLADPLLWEEADAIVERMQLRSVLQGGLICTNPLDLERGLQLQARSPISLMLSAATGPNEVQAEGELFYGLVEEAAFKGQLHAIGETGLDCHWQTSPLSLQKEWFIRYMQLALKCNLPLVIHCRKAFPEIISLLDAHYLGQPGARKGVFHCFADSWKEAQEVIKRGFYISFSGIVTYKSALELQEVARLIPSDAYVIETDSPYLNPSKDRAKRNEPGNVVLVAEMLARLRSTSLETIARESTANACLLFEKR